MPHSLHTAFQNLEVNVELRSVMIDFGRPRWRLTCLTYNLAKSSTVVVSRHGIRYRILVRWQTMTKIAFLPFDYGRPVTKFMDTSCNAFYGIGKGQRMPYGVCRLVRDC